jgi:photosynthetic reaction center H subunit
VEQIGAITSNIDVAQVVLYAFWIFFAGLIFYLRREDRREGYPLEADVEIGRPPKASPALMPPPKTFRLANGETVTVPNDKRDDRPIAAERVGVWSGAPSVPTGNPMTDGVGPAAYAERAERPDVTDHGDPRIVPMRLAEGFTIAEGDPDPRGMDVLGADGRAAGTITDCWVDRAEHLIRYFEVEVVGGKKVLLPVNFTSTIEGARNRVTVKAITAAQFADVPATASGDQVTLREEDRITGYYGGGKLYATPDRSEPFL